MSTQKAAGGVDTGGFGNRHADPTRCGIDAPAHSPGGAPRQRVTDETLRLDAIITFVWGEYAAGLISEEEAERRAVEVEALREAIARPLGSTTRPIGATLPIDRDALRRHRPRSPASEEKRNRRRELVGDGRVP